MDNSPSHGQFRALTSPGERGAPGCDEKVHERRHARAQLRDHRCRLCHLQTNAKVITQMLEFVIAHPWRFRPLGAYAKIATQMLEFGITDVAFATCKWGGGGKLISRGKVNLDGSCETPMDASLLFE